MYLETTLNQTGLCLVQYFISGSTWIRLDFGFAHLDSDLGEENDSKEVKNLKEFSFCSFTAVAGGLEAYP